MEQSTNAVVVCKDLTVRERAAIISADRIYCCCYWHSEPARAQTAHTVGFFIVSCDFNHANFKSVLQEFHRHVELREGKNTGPCSHQSCSWLLSTRPKAYHWAGCVCTSCIMNYCFFMLRLCSCVCRLLLEESRV